MKFTMKFRDGSERQMDTEELHNPLIIGEISAESHAADLLCKPGALRAEAERATLAMDDPGVDPGAARFWCGFRKRLTAIADEMERREAKHSHSGEAGVSEKPRTTERPCPCASMIIDDCAGECGEAETSGLNRSRVVEIIGDHQGTITVRL